MKFIVNKISLNLSKPLVMGILNVSPDSFSDGGEFCDIDRSIDRAASIVRDGADFIDIGGESTRPGACIISDDEEADRVIPVVEAISKRFNICISVNTSKAVIIKESAAVGAHIINDVRSLNELGALEAVVDHQLSVCLVHMNGSPDMMQCNPYYENVIYEVGCYFVKHISRCENAGLDRNKLMIDPGFGFGKNLQHNYRLLSHLTYFNSFDVPILVGMSRKSMIGNLIASLPKQRMLGSVVCAVIAAMQGAKIIRVHDVKETVDALKIVTTTLEYKETFFV